MVLYNLALVLALQLVRFVALWNKKMRLWVDGRKNIFERMQAAIASDDRVIWFHAASLGEFEEGRPVIEKIRATYPGYKILLTFFSPSGYEVRKSYAQADWVFYLPADTKSNVKRFLDIVHPEIAVFIKYEFWFNLLDELSCRPVRTYVISARFIPDSRFFKWYGAPFRKSLAAFDTIFVQDKQSVELLDSIGIKSVIHAGDPRFDRVATIAAMDWRNEVVEKFKNGDKVFIAGSTCGAGDDDLVLQLINMHPSTKFIVVPHDLDPEPIQKYQNDVKAGVALYSECNAETDFSNVQVLIYNTIGTLAMLYRYGNWAYIGGGFIAGIHSVIEATVYGLPCVFGPNFEKNRPGGDMVRLGACGTVKNITELNDWFTPIENDDNELAFVSKIAFDYSKNNTGATETILSTIFRQNA